MSLVEGPPPQEDCRDFLAAQISPNKEYELRGESLEETHYRILFVEDHSDSRELISILLRSLGLEVITADSVAQGMSLIASDTFDLYLLDSQFPDGSGLDLCRTIREMDADVPVVFYSALGYDSDIEAGLEAGAQAYIVKPDGINRLEETIDRLLKKGPAISEASM